MEVPDTAWVMRTPKKLHQKNFHNRISGSTLTNMAYGGSFWAPGPLKLTFLESKRCHIANSRGSRVMCA